MLMTSLRWALRWLVLEEGPVPAAGSMMRMECWVRGASRAGAGAGAGAEAEAGSRAAQGSEGARGEAGHWKVTDRESGGRTGGGVVAAGLESARMDAMVAARWSRSFCLLASRLKSRFTAVLRSRRALRLASASITWAARSLHSSSDSSVSGSLGGDWAMRVVGVGGVRAMWGERLGGLEQVRWREVVKGLRSGLVRAERDAWGSEEQETGWRCEEVRVAS